MPHLHIRNEVLASNCKGFRPGKEYTARSRIVLEEGQPLKVAPGHRTVTTVHSTNAKRLESAARVRFQADGVAAFRPWLCYGLPASRAIHHVSHGWESGRGAVADPASRRKSLTAAFDPK